MRWSDGRGGDHARGSDGRKKPALFLQPLAAADATASARTPSRTENYLVNALGEAARSRIEDSPVISAARRRAAGGVARAQRQAAGRGQSDLPHRHRAGALAGMAALQRFAFGAGAG